MRTDARDDYAGSAEYSARNSWQAYYSYAKQLYSAGQEEQANQYYNYALQLYNAEVQKEQQPSNINAQLNTQADSTTPDNYGNAVNRQPQQGHAPQESTSPTWETYYQYAKQLYSVGNYTQADEYFRYAQQLYSEVEKQSGNQNYASSASDSGAPQASLDATNLYRSQSTGSPSRPSVPQPTVSSPYRPSVPQPTASASKPSVPQLTAGASRPSVPQPTASASKSSLQQPTASSPSSYATTQSLQTSTGSTALSTADTWNVSGIDVEPQKRSKPSLKAQFQIWTTTLLVSCLALGIGGFIGLFYEYKNQLSEAPPDKWFENSFLKEVKSATIKPMVNPLRPTFYKTNRIFASAGPLLYELHLSDTPPESPDSKTSISLGASKKSEATQPNEQVNEKKEVTDTTEETVAPPPRTDEADAEAPKPTEASDEATPDSPEKEAPAETAPPENEEADNPEADEPAITENAEDTPSAETNRNLISKQKQWAKRAKAGRTHTGAKKKFGKKKRKKKGELSNDPMAGFEL